MPYFLLVSLVLAILALLTGVLYALTADRRRDSIVCCASMALTVAFNAGAFLEYLGVFSLSAGLSHAAVGLAILSALLSGLVLVATFDHNSHLLGWD